MTMTSLYSTVIITITARGHNTHRYGPYEASCELYDRFSSENGLVSSEKHQNFVCPGAPTHTTGALIYS